MHTLRLILLIWIMIGSATTSHATTRSAAISGLEACKDVCGQYRQFSWAIAKQEGFFVKKTIAHRLHNPGDLKTVAGYRYPGQVGTDKYGHAIFKNEYWGWAALEHQVRKMCVDSQHYSPQMSIQQVGKKYAKDWKRWSANVARNMQCDPHTTLAELFDIPPVVVVPVDWHRLDSIIQYRATIPSMAYDDDEQERHDVYEHDQLINLLRLQLIA